MTPVVTDILLAKAYLRMLEDDTLDVVFYQSRPSLVDFMTEYLTAGRRITLGCFRETGTDTEPEFCGLGWAFGAVQMSGFTKAECGMVFFKGQSSRRDNVTFGRLMLEVFFSKHKIDVIFGTTPEANQLAIRYAQRLGFSLHGPLPNYVTWKGQLAPGWISHMSKDQWMERGV